MFARPPLAGAPEAGLYLVEDEQRSDAVAGFAHRGQIRGRWHDDAPLTLNRFEEDRGSALIEHRLQCIGLAEGYLDEVRHQRFERIAKGRATGRGE